MAKHRLDTVLTGVAGEYFVAAELSRRGIIATLTARNTKGIDILAALDTGVAVGIQVKTNQGGKEWLLGKKAETAINEDLFYVLVNLNGVGGSPDYHIVESKVVARYVANNHREWLKGTKRDGSARKDTDMRTFPDREDKFRDAWDKILKALDT